MNEGIAVMINRFRPLAAVVAALVTAGLFAWLGVVLGPGGVDNYHERSAP